MRGIDDLPRLPVGAFAYNPPDEAVGCCEAAATAAKFGAAVPPLPAPDAAARGVDWERAALGAGADGADDDAADGAAEGERHGCHSGETGEIHSAGAETASKPGKCEESTEVMRVHHAKRTTRLPA